MEESCDGAQEVAAVGGCGARPGGEGSGGGGDGVESVRGGGALVCGRLVCGGRVEGVGVVDY